MPSSLILCNNNKLFLDQIVMCSEKWVWQLAMTDSLVGLRRSSKALPKAKLAPEKGHGHCLVVCWSTTAFWTPTNPIYLRSILNKSMICTENCNACRWHWSTEWAQFFSMTISNDLSHNSASKFKQIGLQSFASSATLTWPLANQLPLLQASWQLFAGKTLPQPAEHRKCFQRVCRIPKHRFFCYRNKQTYFSLAKMCWL